MHEWTEIELYNERDINLRTPEEWSWEEPLSLSPSARLLTYSYPVHEAFDLNEEEILNLRGSYNLLIFRDARNYEIKSLSLTDFVYNFLTAVTSGTPPPKALSLNGYVNDLPEVRGYLENFLRELLRVGALY
ncbi:MAG: hypothetical protein Q9N34_02095 [Aquificota bacterium]|nr:hypothetical protein [Aquificota bacterium]